MGVVCAKVAEELLKEQNGEQKPVQDPPDVHDVLIFPSYGGRIGKVHAVSDNKCEVIELGPDGKDSKYDWEGYKKVESIPALQALILVDGELDAAVTAPMRGADCHGWVVRYDVDTQKVSVKFRPDAAFKVIDPTDFKEGDSEEMLITDVKKGHVEGAAERPRNRNAAEIAKEKNLVKSYGVAYIHCAGCGIGVWDNPCDCFITQKRKGFFCQECGKKHPSANSICCSNKRISQQAQNQGWAHTLAEKYGYL